MQSKDNYEKLQLFLKADKSEVVPMGYSLLKEAYALIERLETKERVKGLMIMGLNFDMGQALKDATRDDIKCKDCNYFEKIGKGYCGLLHIDIVDPAIQSCTAPKNIEKERTDGKSN